MITRWPIYLIPICLLLSGCFKEDYYRSYLEEQAGFTLPQNTTNENHFIASDLAFTSHYTLPLDSVYSFSGRAGLSMNPPNSWDPILFTEELSPPWDLIPEQGSFLYGAGSSGWNSWDILLNADTGDLWATVYYTDASGDPP